VAPQVPNVNWPRLYAEGNFSNNPFYTPSAAQVFTDLTPRLQKPWSVRRGKQFELDQVQPGEFHGEWANKDGYLDPTDGSSPYSPGVLPFRGYRMRAQYPPSVNLLTADQATGGEGTPLAPGTIPASVNAATDVGATLSIVVSGTPFQGTQVFNAAVPGSATVGNFLFYFTGIAVQATSTSMATDSYTWSVYVRSGTSGANPSVAAAFHWFDVNNNSVGFTTGTAATLTGSAAAAWTQVSVSAAPLAGAVSCAVAVKLSGSSPGSPWTFQLDGAQLQNGMSASAFSVPGTAFSVFNGMVERYPQTWEYSGTYGVVQPVCVDTMALLSQTVLKEAFVMDVVALNPTWFFQFNEPNGSTSFSEQGGRVSGQAGIFSAVQGAGTLTAGSVVTAAAIPAGKFFGTNGPVVNINNPNQNQGTVIDLTPSGVTSPPTSGAWTRMIAYRCAQTTGSPVFAAYSAGQNPSQTPRTGNMYWGLQVTSGSLMGAVVTFYNAAGQSLGANSTFVTNDNNWHLTFVQMSADGKTVSVYSEGVLTSNTGANDMHSSLVVNESVGGDMYKIDGSVGNGATNYVGDVALYAEWTTLLTLGQMNNLRTSFMTAFNGESSDARYGRILGWAGYQGTSKLDAGTTTAMNYANDVANVDALTALQNVVNTEGGRHFVDGGGAVNFQSRQRYFQQGSLTAPGTPVWVFGENAGEIPYTELAFDYDPTRISNQIAVTQNSTNLVYNASDTTSQQNYGVRNFSRSSQSTNSEEVRESAFYYLSRYKDPHLRVQAMKINVSANPALWSSALAFELGQYVQINRRDPFGVRPTITMFGFIEQITHSGDDKGAWSTDLEISPAQATPYATFTALHTTLSTGASSGQPVVTINALPDAATNPVRSEIYDGQVLLISGGGNSESITVAKGGVQDQLAGYTTATITATTNLVHSYSTGAAVEETAAPTTWDSLAVFDSVQFSY
jgi:hypothetical protein